jgi:hypothetical protein
MNQKPPLLSESEIYNLKNQGEIVEIMGYDCFNIGMEISFIKDDLQCDKCGKIIKRGEKAGMWYFAVRYPQRQILLWSCGCSYINDLPVTQ